MSNDEYPNGRAIAIRVILSTPQFSASEATFFWSRDPSEYLGMTLKGVVI